MEPVWSVEDVEHPTFEAAKVAAEAKIAAGAQTCVIWQAVGMYEAKIIPVWNQAGTTSEPRYLDTIGQNLALRAMASPPVELVVEVPKPTVEPLADRMTVVEESKVALQSSVEPAAEPPKDFLQLLASGQPIAKDSNAP